MGKQHGDTVASRFAAPVKNDRNRRNFRRWYC